MATKTSHTLLLLLFLSYLIGNIDARHRIQGITMHIETGPSSPCGAPSFKPNPNPKPKPKPKCPPPPLPCGAPPVRVPSAVGRCRRIRPSPPPHPHFQKN
ncbi:hypothetical protein AALP_AA6G322800 [Arabis alpina]|uniref:Uncharacterized protein n=1 Tax=Arabis alpina TaxID=50452 RepID=A0A087GT39_ARAAL|nr:hypothetical protein AALP_AA6G322800 [Arabis alpina]